MVKSLKIKALVIDIDGTLTDEARLISTKAIECIRALEGREIKVMLASGNVLPIMLGVSRLIGATGPLIAENGGIVYYEGKTKILGDSRVPLRAYEFLKQRMHVKRLITDRWRMTEVAIEDDDVEKVKELLKDWDLKVESTGFAIHLMSKGIDKFNGVRYACKLLQISPKQVMAIGDSDNDIEMIRNCGIGVAVGNATNRLKENADYVTESSNGDGVVEAIEEVLINRQHNI